jgi:hypothetical protein
MQEGCQDWMTHRAHGKYEGGQDIRQFQAQPLFHHF